MPVFHRIGDARDHQARRGVEHDDVAVRAVLAVQHAAHHLGVLRRRATDQLVGDGRRESRVRPGRP